MAKNKISKDQIRFFAGYSGWGEDQLKNEIKENNWIVLGKEEDLYSKTIFVYGVNWLSISPPKEQLHVTAKLRYSHQGVAASVFPESDNKVRLELDVAERAVTPGQAAVFYQDEILLGGGWINDLP